ncbi:hypothetical protein EJB05_52231, partial [Eragrostis curvula]
MIPSLDAPPPPWQDRRQRVCFLGFKRQMICLLLDLRRKGCGLLRCCCCLCAEEGRSYLDAASTCRLQHQKPGWMINQERQSLSIEEMCWQNRGVSTSKEPRNVRYWQHIKKHTHISESLPEHTSTTHSRIARKRAHESTTPWDESKREHSSIRAGARAAPGPAPSRSRGGARAGPRRDGA